MNDIESPLERLQRQFKDTFGIDVVEPTQNGCWFEQQHDANGNRLANTKLTFIAKGDLLALSALVEEKAVEYDWVD